MRRFDYNKKLIIGCLLLSSMASVQANSDIDHKFRYPFYVGITGGYGATTWDGLVPSGNKQGIAINISTPTEVTEGGVTWGAFVGYEFFPYFAVEGSYQRYPNAKVDFDPMSLFSFENNGLTSLNTHTETISLMGKIMLLVPRTCIRAYSSFGAADVHRYDEFRDQWRISPTFGIGFNYNFTDHIMGELGGTYTAGYGESELNPAEDYMPFLYSAFLRLAFRF